jgi:acetyl esterase
MGGKQTMTMDEPAADDPAAASADQPSAETAFALDPDMQAAIDKLAELGAADERDAATIAERRAILRRSRAWFNEGGPVLPETRHATVPTPGRAVPVRIHYPLRDRPLPTLVYFHGGGWVMGDLDTHDRLTRHLAEMSGLAVVSVDYCLAPEHKFPQPVDEAIAVVDWLAAHGDRLGATTGRLAVGGDSAGANLALAAALALNARGDSPVATAALLYGVYDSDLDTGSYQAFGDGRYGLSRADMDMYWSTYVRADADRADPRAAVLRGDLAGLPPLFLGAAALDPLRDDTIRLAHRLQAAGVPHHMQLYSGVVHGFANLGRLVPKALQALSDAAEALHAAMPAAPKTVVRGPRK